MSKSAARRQQPIDNPFELPKYRKVEKLGEGTYGAVFKVIDEDTNETLAMKRISLLHDEEGVPGTALREIALMKELNYIHIAQIKRVTSQNDKLYILMEYCDLDLRKFLDANILHPELVKIILMQIMRATNYCHCHRVMHRDLKPQNILLKFENELPICKLCDFGLARSFNVPVRAFTHEIVTLWYRAPEILLNQKQYSTAVDVWSIGCIFAELVTGVPLFQGRSEVELLFEIFSLRGTPSEETWPGVSLLEDFSSNFPKFAKKDIKKLICEKGELSDTGFDLLEKLLEEDPAKRIGLVQAMEHEYFK